MDSAFFDEGTDAEQVQKVLTKNGIPRQLAKDALKLAEQQGRFTIFALVRCPNTLGRSTSQCQ